MKILINKTNFLLFILFVSSSIFANNVAPKASIFDQMYQDEVLEVTIKTDVSALIEHKNTDKYQPASFSYENQDGTITDSVIKLKARGKYRRRVCDFPPIKIKFNKDGLKKAGLSKHNDLKLVTHCLDSRLEGNANVFKEYLTYKMYNILTPNSFRVQLVKITYIDDANRNRKMKRYGFLIEDTDELAERLGAEECDDCRGLQKKDVDQRAYNQMAAYQYLIGNEDWNIQMMRNTKVVTKHDGTKLVIPYDFDFSGIVNASYAIPSTDHNHTTLTERAWLGDCVSMQELFQIKMKLDHCESKFHRLIDDFKLLESANKIEMRKYIDTFYAENLMQISSCAAMEANEKAIEVGDSK